MKTRFRHSQLLLAALALLLLGACTNGVGSYFAPTAALVNGEKIPEADLTRELRDLRRQIEREPSLAQLFQGKGAAANRREEERQILTRLIQRLVLSQAATKAGVTISDQELDRQVALIAGQIQASGRDFSQVLEEGHLTVDQLKKFLRTQALIEKVGEKIGTEITVPEDQVRAFYDQNKATFDGQIQIAHVLVCQNFDASTERCNDVPEDQTLASTIASRARAGEDFAALASQYSKDPTSGSSGGVYGWIGPPARSPFEQAALDLSGPHQVSDPLQSPAGWHVIKVLAKGRPLEAAKDEINERLVQPLLQEAYTKFLTEHINAARIRVNPKYGRFDPDTHAVVAREPARA